MTAANMMIGGEIFKVKSDTTEGIMSLEKHAKKKIDIIKNIIKVIEGDLKRFDESHDLKMSYDKLEEE